jgi:hypothetical protein
MRFGRTGDHQTSVQQILAQPPHVRLVRELLEPEAVSTRSALARELCQRLDLRDPNGGWRLATTLKALRDLEAQGFWTLPAATVPPPGAWNPTRLHRRVQTPTAVPACVEEVRGLQLIEVTTAEELKIWNELMIREHPLHQCRLVGRQLRYLVASEHGWLGAIGFGSAALYLEDQDEWIGWTASQRLEHLPQVLNMNRFLIRPRVRCENLASQVLSLCARRLAEDFERRYDLRPWLLESFVDRSRYDGCCYQAANWIPVGQTKGGRQELGPERLLQTHRTQTLRRMKKEPTVLILQDTTELNFSTRSACEGLGQSGTNQTGAQSRGLDGRGTC